MEAMMRQRRLLTVKQVAQRHPGIAERTLRHWIFNAKERRSWAGGCLEMVPGNGFDRVIVRKGTKILIDEFALFDWLEQG
jgi:hypothetical protein